MGKLSLNWQQEGEPDGSSYSYTSVQGAGLGYSKADHRPQGPVLATGSQLGVRPYLGRLCSARSARLQKVRRSRAVPVLGRERGARCPGHLPQPPCVTGTDCGAVVGGQARVTVPAQCPVPGTHRPPHDRQWWTRTSRHLATPESLLPRGGRGG